MKAQHLIYTLLVLSLAACDSPKKDTPNSSPSIINGGSSSDSGTSGSDNSNTSGSDNGSTSGSDNSNTSGSDNGSTSGSDNSNTSGSGNSNTSGSDNSNTSGSDNGSTSGSGNGSTSGSDNSNTSSSDSGNTSGSDSGNTSGSDSGNTSGSDSGNTSGSDSGNTSGSDSGNTSGSDSGNTSGSDSGNTSGSDDSNNANQTPIINNTNPYPAYGNNGITTAVATDKTLYSVTHSWKVTPPTTDEKAQIDVVLADTNKIRTDLGLTALTYDARLSAYAQRRAEEIAKDYAIKHNRINGQDVFVGITGNAWKGENIAAGYESGANVVVGWKNSSGHYANMIDSDFTKIGIGHVYVKTGTKFDYYWVQIFGSDEANSNYYFDTNIAETDNQQPLTTLLVDGVSIPLNTPNGNWQTLNNGTYEGTYNGYSYTRFGVLTNAKANTGLYQTFYQGTPTPFGNMPQTGTAQYVGKGVWVDGSTVNNQLTAQFDVNFGNKTVSGKVSDSSNNAVNMSANISGNTFHSAVGAEVETHGGFFGTQANEMSGDFREQKADGKFGAFGATKQ